MTKTTPKQRNDIFSVIARKVMNIETLETRRRDRLDFHDVAVWNIQEAVELAFRAGQRIAEGERPNTVLRDLRK